MSGAKEKGKSFFFQGRNSPSFPLLLYLHANERRKIHAPTVGSDADFFLPPFSKCFLGCDSRLHAYSAMFFSVLMYFNPQFIKK